MKSSIIKQILAMLPLSMGVLNSSAISADRISFNDGWKFSLSDSTCYADAAYADSLWRPVSIPHDWSREHHLSPSLASCTGYLPGGIGWYRKHFTYNASEDKPVVKIYFEGIYNRSEVYLNGNKIGERPNGYASVEYDLTPWIKDGENTLAVRVDHSRYADSRWYTGSGIYRDVWLESKPSRHIANWGLSYNATVSKNGKTGNIDATIELEGEGRGDVVLTLRDMSGKTVVTRRLKTKSDTIRTTLKISSPKLWELDSPYLYSLEAKLITPDNITDTEIVPLGFRTISFDPDHGFALNGHTMKIKGVCLHHDGGVVGAAVPDILVKHRLKALKNIGVNAIRCSHNPQAPIFYELCDSLGLMVMDEGSDEWEFPKRKWVEGWNVGTPSFDGTSDFFEEWIEKDITDMVRRDRVHPSVILWSVGNEVDYPNDPYSHPVLDGDSTGFTQPMFGGYNPEAPNAERIGHIARRLANCIRRADATRPVTGALAGVVMSNCTEYPEAVDIVGYNYTESRYETDHKTYPDRIIYGSENRSDYDAWKAVRDHEFISGQFIWTGADYLGESGRWPSRGLGTGLLDFSNEIKPRGHFRASLWSDKPVAYIGTQRLMRHRSGTHNWVSIDAESSWNYIPGETVRVVCYTNAPSARLLLNGSQIGDTKDVDDKTGVIYWDIDFQPGTLSVEALNSESDVVATDSTVTVTRPASMKAEVVEKDSTHALVKLQLIDDNGNICTPADNMVSCMARDCELLGLENGNNSDMSDYTSHSRRFHRGTILAIVKLGTGENTLIFRSPLIEDCIIKL